MTTRALNTRIWLLRVLGVVVAFVGGIVFDLSSALLPVETSSVWATWGWALLGALALEAIFFGFVAAVPIRSWWAVLVVAVTFAAGAVLMNFYRTDGSFDSVTSMTSMLLIVLAAMGAAIGTLIIKRMERGTIMISRPS